MSTRNVKFILVSGGILLLCAAGAADAQGPSLSPPRSLSGDAAIGAATGDQNAVAIAAGGGGFLTAWSDRRAKLSSNGGSSESSLDLFALRLDAAGEPVDAVPLALSQAPGDDTAPQVTWNGTNWLVTWVAQAPFDSLYASAVVGRRVSPAGELLDAAPFTILGEPFTTIPGHTVASDGAQWVVVSGGSTSGLSGVLAVRVSGQGFALDPTPIQLMPPDQFAGGYHMAFAQGVYLLAWSDWTTANADEVYARRFNAALQPLDASAFLVGSSFLSDSGVRVATNGSGFLVAWSRFSSSTYQADVKAARVTTGGVVLDPAGIALTGNKYLGVGGVAATWDGAQWYVGWNYNGLELTRVTPGGSVLDYDGFKFHPTQPVTQSGVVLSPSSLGGVQLAWTDNRMGSYEGQDIYGAHLLDPQDQGNDTLVSLGAPAQVDGDLATDGTNHALVYRSETSGERRILVARMDSAGRSLDPEPIEIVDDLFANDPSIGWDGSVYLITWWRSSSAGSPYGIYARRMAADGTLVDVAPHFLGTGSSPEVSGLDGEFLIAYATTVAYPLQQFPTVLRVRGADGAVLSGPRLINSNYAVQFDVCTLGGKWLVVWTRNYWNNDPHCDIQASLVDRAGNPGSTIFVAGSFNWYNHSVSVASSGNEALLLWVYGNASNLTRRLNARRIRADGTFLDPGPITVLPGLNFEQFNPAVAWDGAQYFGVFQDHRNKSSTLDQSSDVYGVRIRSDGVVLDPQGVAIERSAASEVAPVVSSAGTGRVLISSSIFRSQAPFAAYRIGTRVSPGSPPGQPQSVPKAAKPVVTRSP